MKLVSIHNKMRTTTAQSTGRSFGINIMDLMTGKKPRAARDRRDVN
jgi:hypothetical protein